jgi:hypothetical protein
MQLLYSSRLRPFWQITFAVFIAGIGLFDAEQALACAACGCTLSTNWQTQGINTTPGYSFNLAYSYLNQDQQRYGTGKASAAQITALNAAGNEIEDYTKTQTLSAALNYTGDAWGATVALPFVQRTHGTFTDAGTWPTTANYLSSSDSSIGDIRVVGRYTGFSADRSAGLIIGAKLPTGSTNATFNDGTAVDPSLQIGTGSTDVILGGFVAGNLGSYGWFVQGTVQHAVSTKSFSGADYRPGDTWSLNTGIRHAKFGARFTPMLQLNLVHRRPDGGAAATPPDALTGGVATGGTLLYLAPGATWRVGGGTSIYGFVQLPVYQNVNSLQLAPRYTLTLGMRQSFE